MHSIVNCQGQISNQQILLSESWCKLIKSRGWIFKAQLPKELEALVTIIE